MRRGLSSIFSSEQDWRPTICKIPLFAARLGSTYTEQPEQVGGLFVTTIDEGDEKEGSFQRE